MHPSENPGKRLVIGREYPKPDENDLIAEMIDLTRAQMENMYCHSRALRQVHAKMHGCVKAEFIIEKNLSPELRVGVFKEERCFPAWVRFSNGVSEIKHDKVKDVRGIAIKLMGVDGEKLLETDRYSPTQDIVLASSPFFFSKDLASFMGLLKLSVFAQQKKLVKAAYYAITNLHLLLRAKKLIQTHCKHLLSIPYFSGTPYQFGDETRAVKYHLRPSTANPVVYTDEKDFNYLRKNMVATLQNQEVLYDFCVQFQTDAEKMPIEDASIVWDSPLVKLATLRIPSQTFDSTERDFFGDNLTYNIWRCLPEHRPLGSFNRGRKFIYRELYKVRSNMNQMHFEEPMAGPDFLNPENLHA